MSFENLDIYKEAFEVAVETNFLCGKLPDYEKYGVSSQVRRSSLSISSNIAEGYGRRIYKNDFIRFLTYAFASSNELHSQLSFIKRVYNSDGVDALIQKNSILRKRLYVFIKGIIKNHQNKF